MRKIIFIFAIIFVGLIVYVNYSKKEYLIASSLPLEGIMKNMGQSVKMGTLTAFKEEKNLINKKITYIFKDDKYEPELTYENILSLDKKNPFLFYGIVGTPTVKKILPFLNDNSKYLYAPFTGAYFLRKNKYVLNFRASYKDELKHIIEYLLRKKITKIAVFYQNDEYGNEIYFYTYKILKSRHLLPVATGIYKRNTFVIDSALEEILKARPQAVIMGSTSEVSAMFIKRFRQKLPNTVFCTVSFVNPDALVTYLHNYKNIIFSEVVPYYKNGKLKIASEFLREFKKNYSENKPTFFAFEAYLANKVLLRALRKLTFPYTSSHLIKMIKQTPPDYLEGIPIHYKNNQLLNKTYLFEYENNQFKELK